nr:hypothetical protein [Mixta theicola]
MPGDIFSNIDDKMDFFKLSSIFVKKKGLKNRQQETAGLHNTRPEKVTLATG